MNPDDKPKPSQLYLKVCDTATPITVDFAKCSAIDFSPDANGIYHIVNNQPDCGQEDNIKPRVYIWPDGDGDRDAGGVRIEIHTSCSEPLYIGQKFGGRVLLVGYALDDGSTNIDANVADQDPCA